MPQGFRLTKIPLKYFIHAIMALKLLLICDGMIGLQPFSFRIAHSNEIGNVGSMC